MSKTPDLYLNSARVAELWAAIRAALGEKADTAALAGYMTAEEVSDAIAQAFSDAAGLTFQAVDVLPETGEANVIYLVPSGEDGEVREQSMYIGGAWVSLGSTRVDLSGCWSKDELRPMTAEELQAILV